MVGESQITCTGCERTARRMSQNNVFLRSMKRVGTVCNVGTALPRAKSLPSTWQRRPAPAVSNLEGGRGCYLADSATHRYTSSSVNGSPKVSLHQPQLATDLQATLLLLLLVGSKPQLLKLIRLCRSRTTAAPRKPVSCWIASIRDAVVLEHRQLVILPAGR